MWGVLSEQENNNTGAEENKTIDYYYNKNRFFNLLDETKKLRELYCSKEAGVSLILSIVITALLLIIFIGSELEFFNPSQQQVDNVLELVRGIIIAIVSGLFGLAGFSISALALLTGTIGNEVISKINDKGKIDSLMSVIFNFYFSGFLTGVTIILGLISFLISHIQLPFNPIAFILISLLLSYMAIFSVIYAIMLLGTCIRIFLLRYYYLNH
jgi:hypothetical protein